jgi:ribosomal protein S18 acetylase RimI-like enzyme
MIEIFETSKRIKQHDKCESIYRLLYSFHKEESKQIGRLTGDVDIPDSLSFRKEIDSLVDTSNSCLVALFKEDNLVGCGIVHECEWDISSADLRYICVKPTHRGKGYGTELIEEMEEYCREAFYNNIWLVVNRLNTRAEKLYKKLSYKEYLIRPVDNEQRDFIKSFKQMSKNIGG